MKKYFIALFILLSSVFFVQKAEASYKTSYQDSYNSTSTVSGFNGILQSFTPVFETATTTFDYIRVRVRPIESTGILIAVLCKNSTLSSIKTPGHAYCGTPVHGWRTSQFHDDGSGWYKLLASESQSYSNTELESGAIYNLEFWALSNIPYTFEYNYLNSDWSGGDFYTYNDSTNFGAQARSLPFELWTISNSSGDPIDLIDPPPYSSTKYLLDKPISLYTVPANGTCKTNGQDRIFIWAEESTYIPNEDDFIDQGIDCNNNTWSTSISGLDLELNTLTFWARDFYDSSSTPTYGYDYLDTEVYLYQNMTFDPGYFSTTTPTTTLASPWLTFDLSKLPVIGSFFDRLWAYIKSRFPWGYIDLIWTIWKEADPSEITSFSLYFDITPEMGVTSTSTLALPILTNINSSSPWNGNIYASNFEKIEDKVTPWIWVGWGCFYLGIIYKIFRKKIINSGNEE